MKWPDFFPKGCPPPDARAPSGTVYRFVRANPPTEKDFAPPREVQPHRDFKAEGKECESCGLSVFTALDDAELMQRALPAMKKKFIAQGSLDGASGLFKETPDENRTPSHCTWWVQATAAICARFEAIRNPLTTTK